VDLVSKHVCNLLQRLQEARGTRKGKKDPEFEGGQKFLKTLNHLLNTNYVADNFL
jgi:hypothetical protein